MSLLTIAWKDLRLVLRDPAALLFMIAVPIVVITIIAASLRNTGPATIRLPVVNEDEGPVAEVLLESLAGRVLVEEVDRATAERIVGIDGDAAAALVLPERLSKNYLTDRGSTLLLLTDPARGSELDVIRAYLLIAEREAAAIADPLFEELLELEERNLTGTRGEIPPFEQHVPGFSLMFVLMAVFFGVAFGLQDERTWGSLTRLRVAPIPRASILGGKLLARLVLGLVQIWILFGFGHVVFGVSFGRSVPTFALMTLAIVFSMTGFSLLVASFARSREQIIPLGLTLVMIVCSIGGCWWPLYQEPRWLQELAHLALTAWAMDGLHDLILRDRSLAEVWPILGALFAYGAGSLALGVWFTRLDDPR